MRSISRRDISETADHANANANPHENSFKPLLSIFPRNFTPSLPVRVFRIASLSLSLYLSRIQERRGYLSSCSYDNNRNCLDNRTGQRSAFSCCPSRERIAYLSTREWIYAHCVLLRAPDRHIRIPLFDLSGRQGVSSDGEKYSIDSETLFLIAMRSAPSAPRRII